MPPCTDNSNTLNFDIYTNSNHDSDNHNANPNMVESNKSNHTLHTVAELQIMCINFRSIVNKLPSFYDVIHTYDPDIIVGCETWLTNDIFSSEIFPPNYTVFRKDRTLQHGGGVFLACRDLLTCVDIRTY